MRLGYAAASGQGNAMEQVNVETVRYVNSRQAIITQTTRFTRHSRQQSAVLLATPPAATSRGDGGGRATTNDGAINEEES